MPVNQLSGNSERSAIKGCKCCIAPKKALVVRYRPLGAAKKAAAPNAYAYSALRNCSLIIAQKFK